MSGLKTQVGMIVVGLIVIVIGLSLAPTILSTASNTGPLTVGCYNEDQKFRGIVKSGATTEHPVGSVACYATASAATTGSGATNTADPASENFAGTLALNDLVPLIYFVIIVATAVGFIGFGAAGIYKQSRY